jgi:Fic family protein
MKRDGLVEAVRKTLTPLPAPHERHFGVVPAAPPEHSIQLGTRTHRLQAAIAAIAQIDQLAATMNDPFYVSRILVRQEAVSSSSIEGTHSTLDELLELEEEFVESRGEAEQVRDYALVMESVIPQARASGPEIFDLQFISDLHRALMIHDPDYRDVPGELREKVVWIGGLRDIAQSTFNPPPPKEVPRCIADTISYLRDEGMQAMSQSIVERMAIAHAHFEAVHPFLDGNGRVGRILMAVTMAANQHAPLYLSPYIEANKQAYVTALKAAQQRLEWGEIVTFIADAIVGTAAEIRHTRDALAEMAERWTHLRKFRTNSAAERSLEVLPNYPVMTVARLASSLSVSFRSANTAIEQLVHAGILRERTGYSRNRIFIAPEVFRIINRPFGEMVELDE